jgi:hypothetical protein
VWNAAGFWQVGTPVFSPEGIALRTADHGTDLSPHAAMPDHAQARGRASKTINWVNP